MKCFYCDDELDSKINNCFLGGKVACGECLKNFRILRRKTEKQRTRDRKILSYILEVYG